MVTEINWGEPTDNFPTGRAWEDEFDGTIVIARYEKSDYNTQIYIEIRPESYEYDSRGMDYDPDSLETTYPRGWYSMGGDADTFRVSEDGLKCEGTRNPNRNTRAVKLILAIREHTGKKLGASLEDIIGASCRWKGLTEKNTNPTTGQAVERIFRYPISPSVGAKGSTLDTGLVEEAHKLIAFICSDGQPKRTRELVTEALLHEDEYGADVIKLVSESSTIDSAIRAEIISRIDERTVVLAQ